MRLLRPGGHATQLQEWYDKLAPLVAGAQAELRDLDPSTLARRSGCELEPEGTLRLALFWKEYEVRPPAFTVRQLETSKTPSSFIQALILTYLVTADGTRPSGRWVAYHDLPGGMFYAQAFRGYAENRLVRELGEDGLDAFCRAAGRLGGKPLDIGDHGYAFQVLPRVQLAAVYWLGDEDFCSQASILFEDTASHYASTDGLAVLGSHLVSAIVRAAR